MRNGKSDGSDERQLYSQATKFGKEIVDIGVVAVLRFSYCDLRFFETNN